MIRRFVLPLLFLVVSVSVRASTVPESDNAGNYGGGRTSGSNGGTNFGAWTFSGSGSGSHGTYIGGTGDSSHNPSFGIFADSFNNETVSRTFGGGALTAGQIFSFDMGATSVNSGAVIGLNLLSGSSTVYTFQFTGGQNVWQANDGGGLFNTTLAFSTNTSINFSFTYKGGNGYTVTATETGSSYTCAACTATNTLTNITGFQFFDAGQGSGNNFGFNDLSVVPEVSTVWSAALAVFGGGFLVRRRRTKAV